MKKILCIILILAVFFLSSCVPETPTPYGIWKSTEPNIFLYISPEYSHYSNYLGRSLISGDEERVFIVLGNGPRLTFYPLTAIRERGGTSGPPLLVGTWEINNHILYLTPTPVFRERLGYERIIFHQAEDYDPINPEDWFP